MTADRHLDYLRRQVEFDTLMSCPWCSSTAIFQIATRGDGLPVMRCPECHLAFLGEVPQDLSVFYDESYFARSEVPGSAPALTGYEDYARIYSPSSFRWLAMLIRAAVGEGEKRLFDLGCATGTFLEAARKEGFDPHGSELSPLAAEAAAAKGLHVLPGPFDPNSWPPGSFDVVTALEVLEHVRDVRTTLNHLVGLLKPEGLLVFFVPNVTDAIIETYGDDALDFNKSFDHTLYFNESFLTTMCEEVFGPGALTLLTKDVEQWGQGVSAALGFVRPTSSGRPGERTLLELIDKDDSLDDIKSLSAYEAGAVALSAAKFFDRPLAEVALARATEAGMPPNQIATIRAQILRNGGELLPAIELLESLIRGTEEYGLDAGRLLIEITQDLLTLMKVGDVGLGSGLRNLHLQFDDMRARLAAGGDSWRTDIDEILQALRTQMEVAEQTAKHTLEMLTSSQRHNAELETDLARLRSDLAAEQAKATELNNDNARLRSDLAAEQAKATELNNDNARLRSDLNEIYVSRAWRVVSKVRALMRAPSRLASRMRRGGANRHSEPVYAEEPALTRRWVPPPESYPYLVSVITPVYNKGETLMASIESVRAQTLSSIEIVVWDDGSTDPETLRVLEEARRLPDVTVFRAPNQGVVGARNSAISLSRGRYISCLDPDDFIAPTYLEIAVSLLETQPEYDIAYPWVHSIGDSEEFWATQDLDPALILRANHIPICAVFRREVFVETGGFSPEMNEGYEDWEFWVHAAERGFRGRSIPAHLFRYRFSRDAGRSRDAQARQSHHELTGRIAALHPRLAQTGVPLDRPATALRRRVGPELGSRRLPTGQGRPVVLTLPWFTTGGADRVVDLLVRRWASQGRTIVVFLTVPLAEGMVNRRNELDILTPYVYPLHEFLPIDHWHEFVASIISSVGSPMLLNVGSAWFYDNVRALRRDFPHLRIVDQQFNTVGHFNGNRSVSEVLDLTIAAYEGLATEIAADGRASPVESVYVGVSETLRPAPSQISDFRGGLGLSPEDRLVAFVGRLADEKRPEWVVRLAMSLDGPKTRVVVIGDGPLREVVAAAADDRSLTWIPELENIETAIAAADLMILPSKIEGIPLVALEALALGTPLLATRVGGLPELEGVDGVTLSDPDDFEAFVEMTQEILGSPHQAIRLPDRFRAEVMLEAYDRLLFDVD